MAKSWSTGWRGERFYDKPSGKMASASFHIHPPDDRIADR